MTVSACGQGLLFRDNFNLGNKIFAIFLFSTRLKPCDFSELADIFRDFLPSTRYPKTSYQGEFFKMALATGFPADDAVKGGAKLFLASQRDRHRIYWRLFCGFRISFRVHRISEQEDSGNRDTSQFAYQFHLKGPTVKNLLIIEKQYRRSFERSNQCLSRPRERSRERVGYLSQ